VGTLVSHDYDTAEGREYVAYLERVLGECRRLRSEGRLPDSDGVLGFLDDCETILQAVRRDVATAGARGASTTRSAIDLSPEEHARIQAMGDSVLSLLEVLELRQAVVLDRTPAVGRVVEALLTGTYSA
jgi:hypothetical protein